MVGRPVDRREEWGFSSGGGSIWNLFFLGFAASPKPLLPNSKREHVVLFASKTEFVNDELYNCPLLL